MYRRKQPSKSSRLVFVMSPPSSLHLTSTAAMHSHCTGIGHRKLTTLLKPGLDGGKIYEASYAYREDPSPNSSKDS